MKNCCREYLTAQFGDDAITGEIYAEYIRSANEKLAEIATARASGDWTAVDRGAHALKGAALATGDSETSDTAIALREAAARRDTEASDALIQRIGDLVNNL